MYSYITIVIQYIVPLDYLHIPGSIPGNGLMENKDDNDDDDDM